jgi:hypothetical protein
MGAACGCGPQADEQSEINNVKIPANGVTLGRKHYTARDIYWIVRLQAIFRGMKARKKVGRLRGDMYHPGFSHEGGTGDYENVNV